MPFKNDGRSSVGKTAKLYPLVASGAQVKNVTGGDTIKFVISEDTYDPYRDEYLIETGSEYIMFSWFTTV